MGALPVVAGIGAVVGLGVWFISWKWYDTKKIFAKFFC
jgi:hypothetical protein